MAEMNESREDVPSTKVKNGTTGMA